MNIAFSILTVVVIGLIPWIGTTAVNLQYLFGIIIPYAAVIIFLLGVVYRIVKWGKSPTPFRIPTTCGQQKTLPWIKQNRIENPSNVVGVIIRMALEILAFRSLFRTTRAELKEGPRLAYGGFPWLWLAALVFHYAFLTVVIRHLRFFLDPVPFFIAWLARLDGLLEVGLPVYMLSGFALFAAVSYLFIRRVVVPQLRYISLAADYFPLFLILCIAGTGILMRYFFKVDVISVRELAVSLAGFQPKLPDNGIGGVSYLFYMHLFYVSVLVAYFPFSKLMHSGGIFLSPTRNLANTNRAVRHINPWNYPVKVHTYAEYEDDFREQMKEAQIPVERD
ncbi:MAG: sulfate reduction electron transfer complex DsrMKJOP subunit DsrM [Deltaproteobacteria bacterium]|nr:sulfate reduction electron transfer complex DsrMKJOP subunit DsrM [Deltaproteobacteria bacterium]MBW2050964.1 sulfate reduction electron transfer complex DsrMKJOP subunit DsrM [Deltaproteobacteria bacterium]MBW2139635.1 sulfate reduction electron transfer complex DsrMKJOP subunit DsrM [Deltaproteobacteria bacterium]MBW2322253.1 sulfate reduction electron transfer complex DsrMKJOP subunit DsrM [Deltaproteobacteria bacterium]